MTKSHSRDDCRVRFGSGSQEGGQSPPNTRKPKSDTQGSGRRISQYRCSSEEKVCRAWREKSNDGYAANTEPTDTASKWATRDESEERKSAYAQTICSFTRPTRSTIHPSALYAYSFGWQQQNFYGRV
jgi:hypothetical protein